MNQMIDVNVNQLPVRTWNHLGMNEAVLRNIIAETQGNVSAEVPDEILDETEGRHADLNEIAAGMGEDLNRLLETGGIPTRSMTSPSERKGTKPARLHFVYQDGEQAFNRIALWAEKDSELTVVMDFTSGDSAEKESVAGIQTKIYAGKDSLVRLVQIQRLGENVTFLNDIGSLCEAGARLEIVQLILNGQNTYEGCKVKLAGEGSFFQADVGYLVQKAEKLDMNYVAVHEGQRTKSGINVSGVLRDRAFKLFRGTIDFQTGSSGAEGEEKEDVLLLDDGVVNQTIPLILCAEEDVQGNHGATVGKLDEELLFYLESRGISQKNIYEMMAQARLEAVCGKIPDEETRRQVQAYLQGGQTDED